jgi:hypothetical protein
MIEYLQFLNNFVFQYLDILDITVVLFYPMFMNIGQFHRRSYSFSLNQRLMTLISESFSDGYYYNTIIMNSIIQTGR